MCKKIIPQYKTAAETNKAHLEAKRAIVGELAYFVELDKTYTFTLYTKDNSEMLATEMILEGVVKC